jgi:hypothetical protein
MAATMRTDELRKAVAEEIAPFVQSLACDNLSQNDIDAVADAACRAFLRYLEGAGLAPLPFDPNMKMIYAGMGAAQQPSDRYSSIYLPPEMLAAVWRAMAAVAPKFSDE